MSTKIEWVVNPDGSQGKSWNPVTGCTKISPGCKHCYAERMSKRLAGRCGYPADEPFKVTYHHNRLEEPLRWRKPQNVFAVSMGDLFHEDVPDEYINQVFAVMALCPQHTFRVLTKRPKRMCQYMADNNYIELNGVNIGQFPPLPNVWLGVTAENQEQADKRIPLLLQTPAAVRFVSVEPMLGPVDLGGLSWVSFPYPVRGDWPFHATAAAAGIHRAHVNSHGAVSACVGDKLLGIKPAEMDWCRKLDWVICGGETGPGARPMHPDWVRSLRDQCQNAGVPFFFKSWGNWKPISEMTVEETDALYYPAPERDPEAARRCKVATRAIQYDGEAGFWLVDGHCGYSVFNVGKKAAGARLDGREYREMPCVDA